MACLHQILDDMGSSTDSIHREHGLGGFHAACLSKQRYYKQRITSALTLSCSPQDRLRPMQHPICCVQCTADLDPEGSCVGGYISPVLGMPQMAVVQRHFDGGVDAISYAVYIPRVHSDGATETG